jgi:hypothetical protein
VGWVRPQRRKKNPSASLRLLPSTLARFQETSEESDVLKGHIYRSLKTRLFYAVLKGHDFSRAINLAK